MAFVTTTRRFEAGIFDRIASAANSVASSLNNYRVYRKTVSELSALSGSDLADIGLNRSMIKSVARSAAYKI